MYFKRKRIRALERNGRTEKERKERKGSKGGIGTT